MDHKLRVATTTRLQQYHLVRRQAPALPEVLVGSVGWARARGSCFGNVSASPMPSSRRCVAASRGPLSLLRRRSFPFVPRSL